ncbi:HAD-IA family hydrolase [Actinopolymorpha sp. B11F2]|uniref:HAD family hydrolase n=1 Tax=Actinopolymorpha sp. B11F2 TaxID=3160862 RepID=UPI0032E469BE
MSSFPFDAVLCDLDGVVRLWDPDAMNRIDRTHGLPPGTLAATAFAPARLQPAVTGRVTDTEWRAAIAADLASAYGSPQQAQAMVDAWSALIGAVDRDMLELLATVRQHVPVVLVSNATTRLEDDLDRLGITDAVDAVVNTSRIGVAKPAAEVYRHAAGLVDADVSRCVFVDDTPGHVDGARAAGMVGIHFEGVDALRTVLSPLWSAAAPG